MAHLNGVLLDGGCISFVIGTIRECIDPCLGNLLKHDCEAIDDMLYTDIDDMQEASYLAITCIELDVPIGQQSLQVLYTTFVICSVVHQEVADLVICII